QLRMRQNYLATIAVRFPTLRIMFVAIWAAVVVIVWYMNTNYEFTPAGSAQPPAHWPAKSHLQSENGPALVVFVHAYCPCSRATLHELKNLLTRFPSDGHAFCVVSYPLTDEVEPSELVAIAREIPGLKICTADAAEEVELFGVKASGTVLYYDAHGKLLFSGGITES